MQLSRFSILVFGLTFNFASLQQVILVNPSYLLIFTLFLPCDFKKILGVLSLVIVFISSVLFLELSSSLYIPYLQLVFDFAVCLAIVNVISNTSIDKIHQVLSNTSKILLLLAILSVLDYIFKLGVINELLTSITLWGNGGSGLPRLSLTFSNPNWGAFTLFLLLCIAIEVKASRLTRGVFLLLILFMQSKSAIAISLFYVLGLYLNNSYLRLLYLVIFVVVFYFLMVFNPFVETASFVNRELMYQQVAILSEYYPQGLMGNDALRILIEKTGEDTMPSLLLLIYSLGYVLFLILLATWMLKALRSYSKLLLLVCILAFSSVYSFLSVSIVSGIGMYLLYMVYKHDRRLS